MSDQPKVALITGVTGQDGAYLSELLPYKRYEGHGIKRRSRLAVSFETSEYTAKADGIGTPRIVEAWHADSGLTTTASKPRAHLKTRRHTVGERN